MHAVQVLCIGKLKQPWAQAGAAFYEDRLRPLVRYECTVLPDSKEKDAERQRHDESARLLRSMEKASGPVWVLDERGERYTSPAFSALFSQSTEVPTLVIGGAHGLTDDVRVAADRVIRLTDMTLPHELCRVLLLEQLYRAAQIKRGTGYHH